MCWLLRQLLLNALPLHISSDKLLVFTHGQFTGATARIADSETIWTSVEIPAWHGRILGGVVLDDFSCGPVVLLRSRASSVLLVLDVVTRPTVVTWGNSSLG